MKSDTKIGLLVGLAVIVVIGTVVSHYLERDASSNRPRDLAATLGPDYRDTQTRGANVPPIEGPEVGPRAAMSWGTPTGEPAPGMAGAPGATGGTGPVVKDPVGASPMGPVGSGTADKGSAGAAGGRLELVDAGKGPLENAVYIAADPTRAPATAPAPAAGPTYSIAKGDTLGSIAKRFYRASGKAEIGRIVAANPSLLKDEKTQLVVGKKLVIPPAPAPAQTPAASEVAKAPEAKSIPIPRSGLLVRPPGAGNRVAEAGKSASKDVEAPAKAAMVKVGKGDTLGSIAARYVGTGDKSEVARMVSRIVAMNKIKDPARLDVGMVLRMPEKEKAGDKAKG